LEEEQKKFAQLLEQTGELFELNQRFVEQTGTLRISGLPGYIDAVSKCLPGRG